MKNINNAYLQLHTAVFLWGFTGVLGKLISMNAPAIVWYRMIFTAIFIGIIITYKKKWIKIPIRDLKRLAIIGLLFAIHWVAFYLSVKLAGASIAMVCLATASIFTAFIYPLFNHSKIAMSEIFIGLIALLGVVIMFFFQGTDNEMVSVKDTKWGIFFGVVAAFLSAIFTVLNKPMAVNYEPRNLVFWEMTFGFLFLSVLSPFYIFYNTADTYMPTDFDYLWLFCLIYFCTVLAQSLAMSSLRKISPFTMTLSVNLEPVYGIMLAFIILKENKLMGWAFYVGVSIIFISLLLQVIYTYNKNKRSNNIKRAEKMSSDIST